MIIGPLALVGGDELHPGNEPQDRLLILAAGGEPAFVVTTHVLSSAQRTAVRSWLPGLSTPLAAHVAPPSVVLRNSDWSPTA